MSEEGSPEWHPVREEYCEAIYELDEDHVEVLQARLAERLGVSRPSVSEAVRRLRRDGLVEATPGALRLTDDGFELAERVVRRHRLAERFLTDVLGLSSAVAHREAGKWEHVISPRVEAAMTELLGGPTTCPHGNPIPGTDYVAPSSEALGSAAPGTWRIERIPEELEAANGVLEALERLHLLPGDRLRVVGRRDDGSVEVAAVDDARCFVVEAFIADRLRVVPSPDPDEG